MPKIGDVDEVKVIHADGTESTVKLLVVAVAGQLQPVQQAGEPQ